MTAGSAFDGTSQGSILLRGGEGIADGLGGGGRRGTTDTISMWFGVCCVSSEAVAASDCAR